MDEIFFEPLPLLGWAVFIERNKKKKDLKFSIFFVNMAILK